MRFRKLGLISLLMTLPAVCRAQADSAARGEVFGTVYDSVGRVNVVGATVQLVSPTNPGRDIHSATSDARGHYVIPGVSPGRYVIGFQHQALDSLALESPLQAVDVRAGERTRADLAVPSPRRIVGALCKREAGTDALLKELDADGPKYKRFGNVIELQKAKQATPSKRLKE